MSLPPSTIRHEFLAIDEGLVQLLHVNESDPSQDWIVPMGHPQARDMQLIGNGRVLIGHHHGWSEFEIASGKLLFEVTGYEGVTAVRRQPDGHTILAGVDIAGVAGVVILELDETNTEIHRAIYPGDYVRLIRQTGQGTFLMSCNDRIREGDREGNYLREYPVEGFYHAWKALRLPNLNLIVSAGYGAFMVELDPAGGTVRKFGDKDKVAAAVNPCFYAMFQLLPNGPHRRRELAGSRQRLRTIRRAVARVRRRRGNRLALERCQPDILVARRAGARRLGRRVAARRARWSDGYSGEVSDVRGHGAISIVE